MAKLVQQGSSSDPFFFLLVSNSDHLTGLTGKAGSVVVSISKNGAAGVTPTGTPIIEVDSTNLPGWYSTTGNGTDTNTLGSVLLHAKDAASDPYDGEVADIVAFNPRNANLGLSNASVNVTQWNGTNVTGTVPPDAIFIRNATAQGGGASTITLDASASGINNLYNAAVIFIRSGTGAGQTNVITAYNGTTKVATLAQAWATNPDATSVFSIMAFGPDPATGGAVTVNANVIQWQGTTVPAPALTGVPDVNVKDWAGGTVPAPAATGVPDINVKNYNNVTAQTDSNNFPKVDVEAINTSTTAAQNVRKANEAICRGTVGSLSTTTSVITSAFYPGVGSTGQFIGTTMVFDADTPTVALQGQRTSVQTSTNSATPVLGVVGLTVAPVSGDKFGLF